MIEIKNKLMPEDILAINLQQEQQGFLCGITPEILQKLEEFEHNYIAFSSGKPVAAFGLIPITNARAMAWALLSTDLKKEMVYLHKRVKSFLDSDKHGFKRIEATVEVGFKKGIRWVEMLGFVNETPNAMKQYDLAGDDHYLYARYYG